MLDFANQLTGEAIPLRSRMTDLSGGQAMRPYIEEIHGNPSSLHWAGREAREAVSTARAQVAALLRARSAEIEKPCELSIGMRYCFQPTLCMLQWRHSGLLNYLNRMGDTLQVRVEGLWIR